MIACSTVTDTRYKNTSVFETPPVMAIINNPKTWGETEDEALKQDLSEVVSLAGTQKTPTIKIKKLFARSWNIVQQALKLNNITIKDKNRTLGVFYVVFAPTPKQAGKLGFINTVLTFFSSKTMQESDIQLTVVWRGSESEIAAKLIPQATDNLLDDEEDKTDFANTPDHSATLIHTLYDSIKHDLLANKVK